MITVPMRVAVSEASVPMAAQSGNAALKVAVAAGYTMSPEEHYHGEYTFTPSAQAQVIPTAGLVAEQDFVIEPIPNNWGLITWDGTTITVS